MKKFELYWKDLNIGSIIERNWDMRSSGDIVYKFDYLAEPSENEHMADYFLLMKVEFNKRNEEQREYF
ncbi:hypothetical protein [Flavobacterium panacagri]|uniref:hypothetical protein n=1 Tax=Flavobacterium panacagri TaxID=3034146 RepID=UPI0025A666DD|nr:hypothetical protein [Flavobacterium panacagri]